MRLLLDEMLAPRVARELRGRGHDVIAVKERPDWIGASDDRVMEIAREQRRAVVTGNIRDFRPRAATASLPGGPGHYGLICIPSDQRHTRANLGHLIAALESLLAAHTGDDDLKSQETWLS